MKKLKHTTVINISKCRCGHDACNSYFISSTRSDGRLDFADALLYSKAPKMLEQLINELAFYRHLLSPSSVVVQEDVRRRMNELKELIESVTDYKQAKEEVDGLTK